MARAVPVWLHACGALCVRPRRPARWPSVPRLAWLLVRDPGGLADDDLALLRGAGVVIPAVTRRAAKTSLAARIADIAIGQPA